MKKLIAAICLLFLMGAAQAEGRYYTEENIDQMKEQYNIGCLSQAFPGEISPQQAEEKARAAMEQKGDTFLCETVRVNLVQWKNGRRSYVVSVFAEGQLPPCRDVEIHPVNGEVIAYHTRNAHEIERAWQNLYGPSSGWEQMDLILFDTLYRASKNVYCLPMPGDLKEEAAVLLAQNALMQQYSHAEETMAALERFSYVRHEKGSHGVFSRVWYVVWQHPQKGVIYQVMIDGLTEEVLFLYHQYAPDYLG